jgi:DNA-binding transcriptional regulator YiaG
MNRKPISRRTRKTLRPMTRRAIERADPGARPLSSSELKRMKRTPQAKIIRRALGMTQEKFAARHHTPLGTLRDWGTGPLYTRSASASLPDCHCSQPGRGATSFRRIVLPMPAITSGLRCSRFQTLVTCRCFFCQKKYAGSPRKRITIAAAR